MKKIVKALALLLLLMIVGFLILAYTNLEDRNPGYKADLKILNTKATSLNAGFAAITITPEVPDRWADNNNDAEYRPGDGDTYTDGNGNGVFDPVWIAGFSNSRAANGIHDELWARTMVIDDETTRIAVVAIDAIGFFNDDVIDIRSRIPEEAGITYAIIASTHDHQSPDLMGIWGESPLKSGVSKTYMEYVKTQVVKSILKALEKMRPARLSVSEDLSGAIPLVKDTRKPEVFDSGLRLIKAIDKENGNTLGSLISWADHPETLWSKNLLISSDFPHYVREGVEKGVYKNDSLVKPGIGGVAVYINGAIGGLMCTHPSLTVKDPFTDQEYSKPSFEKAEAQGKILALLALNAMDKPVEEIGTAEISLITRTVFFPVDNKLFQLGTAIGTLDRGTSGWMKMRSEVSAFNIGPLSFVTIPGEVYPEIINGGVEAPEGRDFAIEQIETPPVREMMKGKYKFVFGLANDEIGYIIPRSQWDADAPYTYEKPNSPYGEENSLGPETAPLLHNHISALLKELNQSEL
jgi:Neutral/alkaline non-lysosomal ceramidase, N-terminal